jgi:hypothetical protein
MDARSLLLVPGRTLLLLMLSALPALLSPAGAGAQSLADYDYENLTFRGIGFDGGYIWPNKVEGSTLYSLRLDLGYLGPAVRLAPSMSYWSSRMRTSELERLADRLSNLEPLREQGVVVTAADLGDIHWSDLSMSVDAHVVWTAPLNVLTYVGAGISLHALNGRGDVIDDTFIEELLDSIAPGGSVLAGVETMLMPRLRIYGEARYTLSSDVRYPALRLGGALMLPPRQ